MSEPNFDMDAAEEAYQKARGEDPALDPDAIEVDEQDPEAHAAAGERDDPPNYLTYEEWIAEGRDPEDYIGKKAFQKRYDDIQDNKRLRKELKQMGTTVQQTMEAVQEWQTDQRASIRKELEEELRNARANEDVDAAIEAQQALDEHDRKAKQQPKGQQQEHEEPEVITNFRQRVPMIDPESDEFDEEFNADVELAYNDRFQRAVQQKRPVTENMVRRWLNAAVKEARELHGIEEEEPRRQESRRNQRGGTGRQQRRGGGKQPKPRAEDFTIENPRNPRQHNAASEIRDLLKEKYGDEAAEGFERSLAR